MDYYTGVLKKYAVFEGRARRREYWMFVLFNAIFGIGFGIIDTFLGFRIGNRGLFNSLYYLAVLIPSLAVGVRRLHDIGKSGWVLVAPIVFAVATLIPGIGFLALPLAGLAVLVIFLFNIRDSDPGDNKYGPNPKGIPAVVTTSVA